MACAGDEPLKSCANLEGRARICVMARHCAGWRANYPARGMSRLSLALSVRTGHVVPCNYSRASVKGKEKTDEYAGAGDW
jgi:hypothetical protein